MSNFMYGTCRSDEYLYISESNMLQIDSVVESTSLRLAACEAFEATNNEVLVESVMEKIKDGWRYVCEKIKSFYNWVVEMVEKIKNWVIKKYNAAKEYLKKKLGSKKDKKEPVTASFDPTCDFGLSISMESGYEIEYDRIILKNVYDVYNNSAAYANFVEEPVDRQVSFVLKLSSKDAIRKLISDHEHNMKNDSYRKDFENKLAIDIEDVAKRMKENIARNTKDVVIDIEHIDFVKFMSNTCDEFKKGVIRTRDSITRVLDKLDEMLRKSQDDEKPVLKAFMTITRNINKVGRPMINATLHSLNTAQKALCAYMKQDAMRMTSPEEA